VPPAAAGALTLTVDPSQTTLRWTLRGFPHTVYGTFRLASGMLTFDTESGSADGCLRVETRSGESGHEARDRAMHERVLETARFPTIALRPTRVEGRLPAAGHGTLKVYGLLLLHGGWHPAMLAVGLRRFGNEVTADAALRVPYVAWGLRDPSTFLVRVAQSVEIDVHTVGVLAASPTVPVVDGCEP